MDATQLTIYDLEDREPRERAEFSLPLPRLQLAPRPVDDGDPPVEELGAPLGPDFGALLLFPLQERGWHLKRVRAFAGAPHPWMFILANDTFEVKRLGETLADVATDLYKEACSLRGPT